jgi:hypothetical protein
MKNASMNERTLFIDVLIVLLDEAVCQQLIKPFHSFSALV